MDLFDYIELNTKMPESEIKLIFRQVAKAIKHLHQNKIVHRDIKDENVILDQDNNIQLIDFGSSAYIKENKKYDTFCGTIDYAAPEVSYFLKKKGYQKKKTNTLKKFLIFFFKLILYLIEVRYRSIISILYFYYTILITSFIIYYLFTYYSYKYIYLLIRLKHIYANI